MKMLIQAQIRARRFGAAAANLQFSARRWLPFTEGKWTPFIPMLLSPQS